MKTGYIIAPVATLWTRPDMPREIDLLALSTSIHIPAWLQQMTSEQRGWLIHHNAVQTQALYGTRVLVVEEKGNWCYCLIPDQYTPKHKAGYPGWIPTNQIGYDHDFHQQYEKASSVWVTATEAKLTTNKGTFVASFLTRLPLYELRSDQVFVILPTGKKGWFHRNDVTIKTGYPWQTDGMSMRMIEEGKKFLGIPYLWSGISSFAFDCSGFAYILHKAFGVIIPRDASAQYLLGKEKGLDIQRQNLRTGDLVYFCNESGRVDHVGLYAGEDQMLHASNSNYFVKIESLWESRYAARFCGAIRFWC